MRPHHHAISYVEFNVTDLPRAREFYERAFGWRFNDYGPDYAGIQAPDGEREIGGLGVGRRPGPGGPLVLVYSEDLQASQEAVRSAGAEIIKGPYDYPGGSRFHLRDLDGNELGVYQPADG